MISLELLERPFVYPFPLLSRRRQTSVKVAIRIINFVLTKVKKTIKGQCVLSNHSLSFLQFSVR